jgi:hypothetical protein
MQRKEPFFRPAINAAGTLQEYRETLIRLRSLTDELAGQPLHAAATEAIRHCLTLMEMCLSAPADRDLIGTIARATDAVRAQAAAHPDSQAGVAVIAEGLTDLVKERRRA